MAIHNIAFINLFIFYRVVNKYSFCSAQLPLIRILVLFICKS